MIECFQHKGLRRFFEDDDRSKLPAELVERIRDILILLDGASDIMDLNRPSLKLHPWRIIFQFEEQNANNVDFVDYH